MKKEFVHTTVTCMRDGHSVREIVTMCIDGMPSIVNSCDFSDGSNICQMCSAAVINPLIDRYRSNQKES